MSLEPLQSRTEPERTMSGFSDVRDVYVSKGQDNQGDNADITNFYNELDDVDTEYLSDYEDKISDNGLEKREDGQKSREGSMFAEGHRFDRKFICIEYPGNVTNPDKAMETLGGIGQISTAVNTPNRRLELRFRPDDGYCKPACGDRHSTTAMLLRVRVKRSSVQGCEIGKEEEGMKMATVKSTGNDAQDLNTECTSNSRETVRNIGAGETASSKQVLPTFDRNRYGDLSHDVGYELPALQILGSIDTEFRFTSLCDFQYLPMTRTAKDPKRLECIYESIYPWKLPPYRWLKEEVPYFLPPAAFSRMGNVQQYAPKTEVDTLPENIIGKSRKRRAGFSNFIYFSTAQVPNVQPKGIDVAMKVKFLQQTHLDEIRQIFEDRPVWSKNALMYKTSFNSDQLKILLPCVAYYFMNGPWRIMWVKLGYDPREDVSARKYQTLDYRLKAMHGLGSKVKCKRNYAQYTLPYRSAPSSKPKPMVLSALPGEEQLRKRERHFSEDAYIYREGTLPPSRQMFYQYCDILVDEVQEMLAKLPDPLPGTKCHEKRGWLPAGFDDQCREIINRQVRAVLRKQMNIPEDHPTKLPRKKKKTAALKLRKARQRDVERISQNVEVTEQMANSQVNINE